MVNLSTSKERAGLGDAENRLGGEGSRSLSRLPLTAAGECKNYDAPPVNQVHPDCQGRISERKEHHPHPGR